MVPHHPASQTSDHSEAGLAAVARYLDGLREYFPPSVSGGRSPATTSSTLPDAASRGPGRTRWSQLRRQNGLSQEQFAWQAGMSQATIARLERQPTARCRSRTLARLTAALGEQSAAVLAGASP